MFIVRFLLNRFLKIENGKSLNIVFQDSSQLIAFGNSETNITPQLVFKSGRSLFKALFCVFNIYAITEMFVKKEIDYRGDILEIFRFKNYISFKPFRF